MAGADDDFEKLLREVDGALGTGGAAAPVRRSAAAVPAQRDSGFLQAAVPRATAVGAVWGVGVGGAFFILPFLQSFSGAVAAFVTGFSVSILGRRRRR